MQNARKELASCTKLIDVIFLAFVPKGGRVNAQNPGRLVDRRGLGQHLLVVFSLHFGQACQTLPGTRNSREICKMIRQFGLSTFLSFTGSACMNSPTIFDPAGSVHNLPEDFPMPALGRTDSADDPVVLKFLNIPLHGPFGDSCFFHPNNNTITSQHRLIPVPSVPF